MQVILYMRWNILVHRPTKELMDRSAARPALAAEAMRSAAKVPDAPSARVLSLVSQTCQRAAIAHSYPLPPGIDIAPPPQEQTTEPSEILTTDGASEVDDMTRNLIASTMAAFRRNG